MRYHSTCVSFLNLATCSAWTLLLAVHYVKTGDESLARLHESQSCQQGVDTDRPERRSVTTQPMITYHTHFLEYHYTVVPLLYRHPFCQTILPLSERCPLVRGRTITYFHSTWCQKCVLSRKASNLGSVLFSEETLYCLLNNVFFYFFEAAYIITNNFYILRPPELPVTYFLPTRHMTCSTGSAMCSFRMSCLSVKESLASSSSVSLCSDFSEI